jgi:hypothetical protein
MKKIISGLCATALVIILLGATCTATGSVKESKAPPEALVAAEQGLQMYITKAAADPSKWGLDSAQDAAKASLGEGYEIAYIGRLASTIPDEYSLLATEDTSLHSTWVFTIDVDGKPESFLTVCRIDGGEYQLAGFGGDATYFGIALDAIHGSAGDTADPILMQYRSQYFMVLKKNGRESVLPVPFDAASSAMVETGHGFVEPSAVIGCIKAQPHNDSSMKTRGDSYLDVWNYSKDEQPWLWTVAIALISVVALGIASIVGGIIANRIRVKRMQQLLDSTLGPSNGRMASTRPQRKAAATHPNVEREWGNHPFNDCGKQEGRMT